MTEGRSAKRYKYFIESLILYQTVFDNSGDIKSILQVPYPLYNDIILKQVEEKRKEKKLQDQRMNQLNKTKTNLAKSTKKR